MNMSDCCTLTINNDCQKYFTNKIIEQNACNYTNFFFSPNALLYLFFCGLVGHILDFDFLYYIIVIKGIPTFVFHLSNQKKISG